MFIRKSLYILVVAGLLLGTASACKLLVKGGSASTDGFDLETMLIEPSEEFWGPFFDWLADDDGDPRKDEARKKVCEVIMKSREQEKYYRDLANDLRPTDPNLAANMDAIADTAGAVTDAIVAKMAEHGFKCPE